MEYKLIYRPYDLSHLIKDARGKKGATDETKDWNSALNDQARNGWKVKNCGAIESGSEVIFWALLEKG